MPTALPRYQLGGGMFIPPDFLDPGSIIETDMPPAEHFRPLNAAARKRMEEWYEEGTPYTKYDENGIGTEAVAYCHRKYKIPVGKAAGAAYKVKVLRRAKEQPEEPEMSAAFAFLKPAQEQKLPPPLLQDDENLDLFEADDYEEEPEPAAKVLQPGPRTTTAVRT